MPPKRPTHRKRTRTNRSNTKLAARNNSIIIHSRRCYPCYATHRNNDGTDTDTWWLDKLSSVARFVLKLGLIALSSATDSLTYDYIPWFYFIRIAIGPEDLLPSSMKNSRDGNIKCSFKQGKILSINVNLIPHVTSTNHSGILSACLYAIDAPQVLDDVATKDVSFDMDTLIEDPRTKTVMSGQRLNLRGTGTKWLTIGHNTSSMLSCNGGDVSHYLDICTQSIASNNANHISLYDPQAFSYSIVITGKILLREPCPGVSVRANPLVLTNPQRTGTIGESRPYSDYTIQDGMFTLLPDLESMALQES